MTSLKPTKQNKKVIARRTLDEIKAWWLANCKAVEPQVDNPAHPAYKQDWNAKPSFFVYADDDK